jgi:hypothetical protein
MSKVLLSFFRVGYGKERVQWVSVLLLLLLLLLMMMMLLLLLLMMIS